MQWFYLLLTILFEVSGTTSLKLSEGFTKFIPSALVVVFYGAGFYLLSLTLKKIDVSIAYAIWSGLGTALVTIVGILWFKEATTVIKIISIGLIILGAVGLNINGGH
jgi:small multidrug resistance pump